MPFLKTSLESLAPMVAGGYLQAHEINCMREKEAESEIIEIVEMEMSVVGSPRCNCPFSSFRMETVVTDDWGAERYITASRR